MAVIVVPFYGGILDRAVHSLDLSICPWMVGFGQSMFNPVRLADHVEAHLSGIDGIAISGLLCELDAVIRQNGVDFVGHNFQHELQKFPSSASVRCFGELGDGELAGAVNGNEQMQLPLCCLNLSDINVKEADWITLEPLPRRLVTAHVRQARDAMTLQAAVQR